MPGLMRETIEERKQKLMTEVLTPNELVERAAQRWTIENMGSSWPETERLTELAENDEMYESMLVEKRDWVKTAKKHLKTVLKAKLPLTLESMEKAFYGEV